ncbi:MAG: hypothetical protein LBU92_04840, partial [Prevotellaceae bacterium]|nr:hypothetical protein [Prevotellaceae bacterium]
MNKIFSSLLIVAAAATQLSAQDETLTKTVEVLRAYEPTIPEAYKINPIPRIDDTASVQTTFTYPLRQVRPLTEEFLINPIAPARVQRDYYSEANERNRGYLRMGFGLKPSTLIDAYYGSERAQKFVWDVFANHYGNFGKVKNEAKEKVPNLSMRNELGGSGKYNFTHGALLGTAGFQRHDLRLYGYETDFFTLNDYKDLPNDEKRLAYNHTYFSLDYKSLALPDSTWEISGTFNFYDYRRKVRNDLTEDALEFSLFVKKRATPTTTFGVAINTDVYLRSRWGVSNSNTVFSIAPEAVEKRDSWEVSAKLNFTLDNVSGKLKPYLYPVLNLTAQLADNMFFPYVELSGEHGVNTYKSLTIENPYTLNIDLRNTRKSIALKGGMKGHVGSMLGYDVNLSYAFVNDMHFFVDSYLLPNYFVVLYDDVKLFTFGGTMRFQPMRPLELKLGLRYDQYTMDPLEEAYNRPSLGMKLEAKYNLWNKLNLYANARVMGGYKVMTIVDEQGATIDDGNKKAGFDLSIGADYRFVDRSSVFVQINNLTNSRYQLYNNYPSYGLNLMLG